MSTYKDYQIILLVKKNGLSNVKPMRLSTRSSFGCLTCKRKKIKCDETKWTCKKCAGSRLECHWPDKVLKMYCHEGSERLSERGAGECNQGSSGSVSWLELSTVPLQELPHPRPLQEPVQELPEQLGEPLQALEERMLEDRSSLIAVQERSPDALSGLFETLLEDFTSPSLSISLPSMSFHELMDCRFLSQFIQKFLPGIAQTHFYESASRQNLMLSGAGSSELLRGIFVACGAVLMAFKDNGYRNMALERCNKAMRAYVEAVKRAQLEGTEDWLLVAVQVLQTLCYRDVFGTSHATRAATHFAAAYKFISLIIFNSALRDSPESVKILRLDFMMIENFVFNYSVTIMFCDHENLPRLVMNPYLLFSQANTRLKELYLRDKYPEVSKMSILAFLIAAKCSWLCRLSLPLSTENHILLSELLLTAEVLLLSLDLINHTSKSLLLQMTVSIARVVLQAVRILLGRILDPRYEPEMIQEHVDRILYDISQPYNSNTIFPVWALLIAGSASTKQEDREFFRVQLSYLASVTRSHIVRLVAEHLDKVWMVYSGLDPLDLLLDTRVLDQICK